MKSILKNFFFRLLWVIIYLIVIIFSGRLTSESVILMQGILKPGKAKALVAICLIAYFAANVGRLSYNAAIPELMRAENMTNKAGGLLGTGFFLSYGIFQLFGGILGDRVSPRRMVTWGLIGTAVMNLLLPFQEIPSLMLVIWCMNGIFQATIWSPILRVVSEYLPEESRKKACVYLSMTYPFAMVTAYLYGSAVIRFLGWRPVFTIAGIICGISGVLWYFAIAHLDRFRMEKEEEQGERDVHGGLKTDRDRRSSLPIGLLLAFSFILILQGALRDGISTWIPSILSDTFDVGTSLSVLSTSLVPVMNLFGVLVANRVYRISRNELKITLAFFGAAFLSCCFLIPGIRSFAVTLLLFSLLSACMVSINMMLVSFVPTYFVKMGKVSFITGLLNSMVYVGSSVSAFGFGKIADVLGWNFLLILLVVLSGAGVILSAVSVKPWGRFLGDA